MNFEIRPPAWFAFAVAAAFAGGFIALWLTDYAVIRAAYCSESEVSCLRDWLGALSGWVAAAGALLVGVPTISILWKQLAAIRKQADFVNGFADPEITVAQSADSPFYQRLTIRNWNRHQIQVFQLVSHADSSTNIINLREINGSGGVAEGYENGDGVWVQPEIKMMIPGWTNRNEAPPFGEVDVFLERKHPNETTVSRERAGFLVHVRFFDDRHRTRLFDAWIPDALVI